jgi:hypothetical protein
LGLLSAVLLGSSLVSYLSALNQRAQNALLQAENQRYAAAIEQWQSRLEIMGQRLAAFAGENAPLMEDGEDTVAALESIVAQLESAAPTPPGDAVPPDPPLQRAEQAPPTEAAAPAPQERSATAVAGAWSVDFFYCEGAGEARHRQQAEALAQALQATPPITLGRVRVRPMSEQSNARRSYRITGSVINAHASESAAAQALLQFGRASGVPLSLRNAATVTEGYLSIFMCESARPG